MTNRRAGLAAAIALVAMLLVSGCAKASQTAVAPNSTPKKVVQSSPRSPFDRIGAAAIENLPYKAGEDGPQFVGCFVRNDNFDPQTRQVWFYFWEGAQADAFGEMMTAAQLGTYVVPRAIEDQTVQVVHVVTLAPELPDRVSTIVEYNSPTADGADWKSMRAASVAESADWRNFKSYFQGAYQYEISAGPLLDELFSADAKGEPKRAAFPAFKIARE